MFKQVVLSTTRPKTPSFFSSSTSTPPRDDSSINDSGSSDLPSVGGCGAGGKSRQYLGRSLSWDIVIDSKETSENHYKADIRRRSKSAKMKKQLRGGISDDDYIDYIDDSVHGDNSNSRISEERSSQEVSSSSVHSQSQSTDHRDSLNIEENLDQQQQSNVSEQFNSTNIINTNSNCFVNSNHVNHNLAANWTSNASQFHRPSQLGKHHQRTKVSPITTINDSVNKINIEINNSVHSNNNNNNSNNVHPSQSTGIYERLHSLVSAFRQRAQTIKSRIVKPLPLPLTSPCESPVDVIISSRGPSGTSKYSSNNQRNQLAKDADKYQRYWDNVDDESDNDHVKHFDHDTESLEPLKTFGQEFYYRWSKRSLDVIDPQSYFYISWLLIVVIVYLYNCWIIFLRSTFPYQTSDNLLIWLTLDYLADIIYLLDILLFKNRLTYLERGQIVKDLTLCRRHYLSTASFKLDVISLAPFDLLYIFIGCKPILRFSRLLKFQTFSTFFDTIDAIAKWPYFFRVTRTLIYMMFLIHLNACAYYYVSYLEGFNANEWVYRGEGNAYIRCFYFAIRTATSISGKMPKPTNTTEYLFMTISWLLGIFVFAFLIGQIRDIVATATQNKASFRQLLDSIVRYMESLHLPCDLQTRVRLWLTHTWEQQKLFDESSILYSIPLKIRTDLAMDIHYSMLRQVDLFQGCERTILRDIVVKLKHVLFLPGDYVCRKGEIGTEMYIVTKGSVQVLRDDAIESVICTLGPGGVFGEVSVLGIPGCSRRTASVRSVGFSNLFKLTKADLWDTLRNYPEAQTILLNKAKQVMRERALRERYISPDTSIEAEAIIKESERTPTPKLFKMVMEVLPNESTCHQILNRSRSLFSRSESPVSKEPATSASGLKYLPSFRVHLPTRSSNSSPSLSLAADTEFTTTEDNQDEELVNHKNPLVDKTPNQSSCDLLGQNDLAVDG
ncbi:cyclic nucleotide-gated cation channel beta-3-like [Panonychus citri]|uniref:cyclic nucleotide-gated cation channel beta-3-like n=1 Tax=Panonychus citri TaxID=50023 RepID=UPI002307FCA8|nr:cyclic nucleotide-gated cation channel beta-3-like [Panonychus citri]